jgi:hypothetical protein
LFFSVEDRKLESMAAAWKPNTKEPSENVKLKESGNKKDDEHRDAVKDTEQTMSTKSKILTVSKGKPTSTGSHICTGKTMHAIKDCYMY